MQPEYMNNEEVTTPSYLWSWVFPLSTCLSTHDLGQEMHGDGELRGWAEVGSTRHVLVGEQAALLHGKW